MMWHFSTWHLSRKMLGKAHLQMCFDILVHSFCAKRQNVSTLFRGIAGHCGMEIYRPGKERTSNCKDPSMKVSLKVFGNSIFLQQWCSCTYLPVSWVLCYCFLMTPYVSNTHWALRRAFFAVPTKFLLCLIFYCLLTMLHILKVSFHSIQ